MKSNTASSLKRTFFCIAVGALLAAFAASGTALAQTGTDKNVLLYLKCDVLVEDEKGETYLKDESSRSNKCRLMGEGYSLTEGISGKALRIDGRKNFISIPYSKDLQLSMAAGFTIQLWLKPDQEAMAVPRWVLFANKLDTSGAGYRLQYHPARNILDFSFATEDRFKPQTIQTKALPQKLNAGEWHHVAVTGHKGTVAFYVDGNKVFSKDGIAGDIPPLKSNFFIGTYLSGKPGPVGPFIGAIEDIMVESAARTEFPGAKRP